MKRQLVEDRASCIQALKRGTSNTNILSTITKYKHNAPLENIIKQNAANIKNNLILTAREKLNKKRTNKKETGRGSR